MLTLSLHLKESGFYPGTGGTEDVGFGKGKYFTINVPLREGIRDQQYKEVFQRYSNIDVKSILLLVVGLLMRFFTNLWSLNVSKKTKRSSLY